MSKDIEQLLFWMTFIDIFFCPFWNLKAPVSIRVHAVIEIMEKTYKGHVYALIRRSIMSTDR